MAIAEISTAFMLGLLGSTHCVGMCGGIAGAFTVSLQSNLQRGLPLFLYQGFYSLGRISSYALIGLLAGTMGWLLTETLGGLLSATLRIIAGILLILLGCYLAGWLNWIIHLEKLGGSIWQLLGPLTKKIHPVDSPIKAIVLGMLWGWLPCGLVYSTVSLAITSANAAEGALIMAAFGLGTLPAVMATGILAHRLQHWLQQKWIRNMAGISVILFGLFTIVPAISHMGHGHHDHQSIHADGHSAGSPQPENQNSNSHSHHHHHHH